LLIAQWVDNSVCLRISNFDQIEPLSSVKRWPRQDNKKVSVPQPKMYETYNKNMGGVDNVDQNLATYRIAVRGKKWWWQFFTYCIDLALVNA